MRISDWSSDVCSSDLEVMLLDLGGKSHDPNPKRKGGYTESTFEQAYMDGLIESVDCEHRPHLNYMLTPKGLDEAVKIWGKQTTTVFIIYGGRMPGEDESTPIKLVPVTADGSDFDMASLPRGLTTDEVEFLGYPRRSEERRAGKERVRSSRA